MPSHFGKSTSRPRVIRWIGVLLLLLLLPIMSLVPGCQRENDETPDISGLTDVLKQSAEQGLPAPAMTDGSLSLPVPKAERAAEAERINRLATELGGGALRTDQANGEVSLMLQIPASKEKIFRSRLLRKPVSEIEVAPAEEAQIWMDITLRDPA